MGKCSYCGTKVGNFDQKCSSCGKEYIFRPLREGSVLDNKYIIVEPVSASKKGLVYKAHDRKLDMDVAVREYLPKDCAVRAEGSDQIMCSDDSSAEVLRKGINEFLAAAKEKARMPAVEGQGQILDAFESNGTAYYVMNFCTNTDQQELPAKEKSSDKVQDKNGSTASKTGNPQIEALRRRYEEESAQFQRQIERDRSRRRTDYEKIQKKKSGSTAAIIALICVIVICVAAVLYLMGII